MPLGSDSLAIVKTKAELVIKDAEKLRSSQAWATKMKLMVWHMEIWSPGYWRKPGIRCTLSFPSCSFFAEGTRGIWRNGERISIAGLIFYTLTIETCQKIGPWNWPFTMSEIRHSPHIVKYIMLLTMIKPKRNPYHSEVQTEIRKSSEVIPSPPLRFASNGKFSIVRSSKVEGCSAVTLLLISSYPCL